MSKCFRDCFLLLLTLTAERLLLASDICLTSLITVNLQTGKTALHLSSERGHVHCLRLLIEAGAALNVIEKVWTFSCDPFVTGVLEGKLHSPVEYATHCAYHLCGMHMLTSGTFL